jgi:hypothetical protein
MAFWNKQDRREYDRDSPYTPQYRKVSKAWYQQTWVWIVVAVVILGLLVYSGTIKTPFTSAKNTTQNTTTSSQPSQEQQLVNYIIQQQDAGVTKVDIQNRLLAAGYGDATIQRAFELADPVVQYIIQQEAQGVSKQAIVDQLLNQGYDLTVIQAKFAIVEKKATSFDLLKKYWWLIALAIIGWYLWNEKNKGDAAKKAPKVYTMEECREYAEEKLKEKKIEFNPSHRYKNRPEIRQYRFCFEEPIYAEFNHQFSSGYKAGAREYFMLAVGYDRELVEFIRCKDDVEMIEWIYGSARPTEARATAEYSRLRERSEVPIEDRQKMEQKEQEEEARRLGYPQRPVPGYPRRPARVPGPIEGYEAP